MSHIGIDIRALLIIPLLCLALALVPVARALGRDQKNPKPPALIAHAGGGIKGFSYTNSLEALNQSFANGFSFFEIDFEKTADNQIVLLHDWDYSITHFFHASSSIYTFAEFKKLQLQNGQLTQLSLSELVTWLENHPNTYIITDFKRSPVTMLKKISRLYPELRSRLIPQIYLFSQYKQIQALGFKNIIMTLYASHYNDQEVVRFAKINPLWAVAMTSERAKSQLPKKLQATGVFTYAHLVNSKKEQAALAKNNINGFYTASLTPEL